MTKMHRLLFVIMTMPTSFNCALAAFEGRPGAGGALDFAARDLTSSAENLAYFVKGVAPSANVYQDTVTLVDASQHFQEEVELQPEDLNVDFAAIQSTIDELKGHFLGCHEYQTSEAVRSAWFRVEEANIRLRQTWLDHDSHRSQPSPEPGRGDGRGGQDGRGDGRGGYDRRDGHGHGDGPGYGGGDHGGRRDGGNYSFYPTAVVVGANGGTYWAKNSNADIARSTAMNDCQRAGQRTCWPMVTLGNNALACASVYRSNTTGQSFVGWAYGSTAASDSVTLEQCLRSGSNCFPVTNGCNT